MSIRIKDLTTTASSPASDDFIVLDGATNGTRKIPASEIGGGGTSDDITNESSVSGETVTDALNSLNDQIANKANKHTIKTVGNLSDADLDAMTSEQSVTGYLSNSTYFGGSYWAYAETIQTNAANSRYIQVVTTATFTAARLYADSWGAWTITASRAVATTSANGLMSSTDKGRLDTLYADYSSAITALGV